MKRTPKSKGITITPRSKWFQWKEGDYNLVCLDCGSKWRNNSFQVFCSWCYLKRKGMNITTLQEFEPKWYRRMRLLYGQYYREFGYNEQE